MLIDDVVSGLSPPLVVVNAPFGRRGVQVSQAPAGVAEEVVCVLLPRVVKPRLGPVAGRVGGCVRLDAEVNHVHAAGLRLEDGWAAAIVLECRVVDNLHSLKLCGERELAALK